MADGSRPEPGLNPARTRDRHTREPGRLAAGLALLLGVLTLWLALPRLVASALLSMRAPVIEQIDAGEAVADVELRGLIASRELALGWVADRATHEERGTALAWLAYQEEPRSAAQKAMLERAVDAIGAGLAAAPAAPKDWMQLAYLLVLLEGDTNRRAAEALLISIRTGPFQAPDFLRTRLFWALAHRDFYAAPERRQIDRQIRLAWRVAPGDLVDLARYVPGFAAPIATALDPLAGAREQLVAALDSALAPSGMAPSSSVEGLLRGAPDRSAPDHGAGITTGGSLADRSEE